MFYTLCQPVAEGLVKYPTLIRLGIFVPIPSGRVFFYSSGGEISLILRNMVSGNIIAEDLDVADRFLKRLKGLMFTKSISPQAALLIYPCSGIHTYFMNYSIDVLYLDTNNIILAIDEQIKPGRLGSYVKGAVAVVELKGGRAKETNTVIGQALEII